MYSEAFRTLIVQKMTSPDRPDAVALAEEKLSPVMEAAALTEGLGAFLRSKGIHEAQLQEWRELILSVLNPGSVQRTKKKKETTRVRELEKELRRKDRALAETAALLVLKKKPRQSGGTRTTARRTRAASCS